MTIGREEKIHWWWDVKDSARRSGWRRLTWMMTEERAAAWSKANAGAELRKTPGMRSEERQQLQQVGPDDYGKNNPLPDWITRGRQ